MPGPVITFDYVAVEIAKLSELYNIRQVAYDLWRINDDEGGAGGTKIFHPALFVEEPPWRGKLDTGGNPVLNAAVAQRRCDYGRRRQFKDRQKLGRPRQPEGQSVGCGDYGDRGRQRRSTRIPTDYFVMSDV